MQEFVELLIGVGVLLLGFPIGDYLAKITKDELKQGQKWFRIVVAVGLAGGLAGLIIGNDFLMFGFFFIAIVTSRSLKRKKKS